MARNLWSNYEVTELTWENGQLAMHELGGMFPPPPPTSNSSSPPKPTWGGVSRANDTLESIVHQATYSSKQGPNPNPNPMPSAQNKKTAGSFVGSSGGKWAEKSAAIQNLSPPPPPPPPGLAKKRAHPESERSRLPNDRESGCASANAGFCRDNNNNDTTMMTWASYESDPRSCTRTKMSTDEDSACHGGSDNQEEEREAKGETGRSYTARKGRAAAVHNQSERRRRDRINQKMKALQKLVPNASKTDKASMLDEVIEYLKQLQVQVQMMSNARFMPQFMMPAALGIQQHLQQMSLLARMGMGAGLGMGLGTTNIGHTQMTPQTIPQLIHPTQVATATSAFVPPGGFVVPQMIPQTQQPNPDPGASSSASVQDQYAALLAQSMNMDLYNTMAALQRQQQQQQQIPAQSISNQLHSNHVQGG